MSVQTVSLDAQAALSTVNTILPFLEAAVPAVAAAAGPVGLGVSAALALIPLIQKLTQSGALSIEDQLALQQRVLNILYGSALSGPQWQPRPESPDATPISVS